VWVSAVKLQPFGFDVHVVPWDFGSFRVPADRFGEQQAVSAVGICDEEFAAFVVSKAKDERGAVVSVSMGSTLVIAVDL